MTVVPSAAGVPPPMTMRATSVEGSAPATARELHVAPPSFDVQMSPELDSPLATQRLTPFTVPAWTLRQMASVYSKLKLGRSTRAYVFPPSSERNRPTSVPTRTMAELAGSTAM